MANSSGPSPRECVKRGYLSTRSIARARRQIKTWALASCGGGGGVCTRGCVLRYPTSAFEADAFDFSATPPSLRSQKGV